MRRARLAAVATALAVGLLAGCTGDGDSPGPVDTSAASPDPTQARETSNEPTDALLGWAPVDAATTDTVTQGTDFVITVDRAQELVAVTGSVAVSLSAPTGFQFNDVISDGSWAVAVAQDRQEVKPSRATVLNLTTGERAILDGRSELPTVNGGSWAIGDGVVTHATYDRAGRYCLASVDLTSMESTLGYCAPKRGGFSNVLITPSATSLLTFSGQPQCRTVARLDATTATGFEDVADCKGWDGAVTPSGAVWSMVANENRIEQGEFHASANGDVQDLGTGTTGSLTWCGDSAYFVRDAQKDADKARLLRWTPDARLQVVYESPGKGSAFLSEPRCAGNVLTLSAFGEGGDEQVWAEVPTP